MALEQIIKNTIKKAIFAGLLGLGLIISNCSSPKQIHYPKIYAKKEYHRKYTQPKPLKQRHILDNIPSINRYDKVIIVSKTQGLLYLFQKTKRWVLIDKFNVVTGKNPFDKRYEGDMATPESPYHHPYIISKKMSTSRSDRFYCSNLSTLRRNSGNYGTHVLVTNYPNVKDRQMGKTGSGIWIHKSDGKGYTRGCIAGLQEDIIRLYHSVNIGTKIVIRKRFP